MTVQALPAPEPERYLSRAELPSEDVAIALGHTDGGQLVRRLYGHRDHDRALDRVRQAYEQHGRVTPLRVVRKDTA